MGTGHNNRLAGLAVNNSGFAFDPHTGESFTLNTTAQRAVAALGAGESQEAVAERLVREYGIDLPEAQADVRDLMEQLRALNLVEVTSWAD